MQCYFCGGTGRRYSVIHTTGNVKIINELCIECHGIGIISCCEGSERGGQLLDDTDTTITRSQDNDFEKNV